MFLTHKKKKKKTVHKSNLYMKLTYNETIACACNHHAQFIIIFRHTVFFISSHWTAAAEKAVLETAYVYILFRDNSGMADGVAIFFLDPPLSVHEVFRCVNML